MSLLLNEWRYFAGKDVKRNLRDIITSHFYELKKEFVHDLDLRTSQLLPSSPSVQIKDEDSRYDFVRSGCENDLGFTSL